MSGQWRGRRRRSRGRRSQGDTRRTGQGTARYGRTPRQRVHFRLDFHRLSVCPGIRQSSRRQRRSRSPRIQLTTPRPPFIQMTPITTTIPASREMTIWTWVLRGTVEGSAGRKSFVSATSGRPACLKYSDAVGPTSRSVGSPACWSSVERTCPRCGATRRPPTLLVAM